jgi:hypothetical protein
VIYQLYLWWIVMNSEAGFTYAPACGIGMGIQKEGGAIGDFIARYYQGAEVGCLCYSLKNILLTRNINDDDAIVPPV